MYWWVPQQALCWLLSSTWLVHCILIKSGFLRLIENLYQCTAVYPVGHLRTGSPDKTSYGCTIGALPDRRSKKINPSEELGTLLYHSFFCTSCLLPSVFCILCFIGFVQCISVHTSWNWNQRSWQCSHCRFSLGLISDFYLVKDQTFYSFWLWENFCQWPLIICRFKNGLHTFRDCWFCVTLL